MQLQQKSSRYSAAVLFLAGVNSVILIANIFVSDFKPDLFTCLAALLIASLILHARVGKALSNAEREIDMLKSETGKLAASSISCKEPSVEIPAAIGASPEDCAILDEVRDAVENDRVDLYLQPIVSLPQRKTRYFEAFSRLRNASNGILRPVDYLDAAERANCIGAIDNLILLRAVQALRKLGAESQHYRVFCNISPTTLFDEKFFNQFKDYLDANADLAPRLVFEFTYPAVEMMSGPVEKNLTAIAERGYAFSVDHVRRFDLNWKTLRDRNFRFVKCSSAMLLSENHGDDQAKMRVKAFRDRLKENNIDLIAEKVEYESHMPEILTMGIDYGQGELFGAPRPAREYIHAPVELAVAS